jgi:hypothetical protein
MKLFLYLFLQNLGDKCSMTLDKLANLDIVDNQS